MVIALMRILMLCAINRIADEISRSIPFNAGQINKDFLLSVMVSPLLNCT